MDTRRPDLSPYLVHLSRDLDDSSARDNLLNILTSGRLEARTPYGIAGPHFDYQGWTDPALKDSQKVVCFSETPLAHLDGLLDPGIWRRYHFRPYGVVFSREFMLHRGANQVAYLNQYMGDGFDWVVNHYNALIDEAALDGDGRPDPDKFAASHVARITPFVESIGEWPTTYGTTKSKDFSFEREWRYVGDFEFPLAEVAAVVVEEGDEASFRGALAASEMDEDDVDDLAFIELERPRAATA